MKQFLIHFILRATIAGLILGAGTWFSSPHVQAADPMPDLIIEKVEVNPPNAGQGQEADIKIHVKNMGDADAAGFFVNLYFNSADNPPTASTPYETRTRLAELAAGGVSVVTFRREMPTDNTKIDILVDTYNDVAESDEANNRYPEPVVGEGDAFEEDDVCTVAKSVENITAGGVVQQRNLYREANADDVDWISISAKSGVTYVIEGTNIGADADIYVEIYTKCDGNPSLGSGVKVQFTAPQDGDYYVKIGNNDLNYGPDNKYSLKVSADGGCNGFFEPNNFCSTPNDISVAQAAQLHSFCEAADTDWLRFETTAGAKYKVAVTNKHQSADAQLSLFSNCSDATSETGQQLQFTASSAGFMYVKVENKDPAKFGPDTKYEIQVNYDGSTGCTEDGHEQDDNAANATMLSVGGAPQKHTTCPKDDSDYVKFQAEEGKTYTIETLNLGPKADTSLCLVAQGGEKKPCDDDSGAGKGSRLTFEKAAAGTYVFEVADKDKEVAGDETGYDVQVIEGYCQPDNNEPNDSLANAKSLSPDGTAQTNNICKEGNAESMAAAAVSAAGDEDWTSFQAAANTSYVIETRSDGDEADTMIELYDAENNLLARNDDFSPGTASRLAHTVGPAGVYYVRTFHYNQTTYGRGTEYALTIRPGTPTTTPTAEVTPTPKVPATPTPPPPTPQNGAQTLILVNRTRLVDLYSEGEAAQIMTKLEALAAHSEVAGQIVRLDNNTQISAAYASWTSDITSVPKANQLAGAIRNVVMTLIQEGGGFKYVVLVGDDRAIPFRRVADNTPQQTEKTYKSVDGDHPTGAAIKADYFLTDDFYVDKEPTPHGDREIYLPDLAIGRLVESPADITGLIDKFLAQPKTTVENVLITGYDFVDDTAQGECDAWKDVMGGDKVTCLIDSAWTEQDLHNNQLRTANPFIVQSINGHADHYAEGVKTPLTDKLTATEMETAIGLDLGGGLIYTLGCHGGLNVPPSNSDSPTDLVEFFVGQGSNYVGNTGYGWGMLNSIGLSEKMIRLFTTNLTNDTRHMGEALASAKRQYYERDQKISGYDEKVIQQLTFYGLPMWELVLPGSLGGDDPFSGVGFEVDPGSLGPGDEVFARSVTLNLDKVLDPDNKPDDDVADLGTLGGSQEGGQFLTLDGFASDDADEPIQALHFGDVSSTESAARSVLILGATYSTKDDDFDPLVGTPINEFTKQDPNDEADADDEARLDPTKEWYPSTPVDVRVLNGNSTLVTQVGQVRQTEGASSLRVFSDIEMEVLYSTSIDQTPPSFAVVDGLYDVSTNRVTVKVGAIDPSGIDKVSVLYIEDVNVTAGTIKRETLTYNSEKQKWEGSFGGGPNSRFYIQAADKAGNVRTADNKGRYYTPAQQRTLRPLTGASTTIFLPTITK